MNCIRCGAPVTPDGRLLTTADGDFVCPSSLPGEAAVHRLAEVLPSAPRAGLSPLAKGVLGFAAGRLVGNLLFRGSSTPPQPMPPTSGGSQVDQLADFLRSR